MEQQTIAEKVRKEVEESDIKYSTEFCKMAGEITNKCNEYKEKLTKALADYENSSSKAEKSKAFKTVEEIYIDCKIYFNKVKTPNTNFYLDNTAGKKYNNRVKRANKLMYETLTSFQKEVWNLGFELEKIDKNLDKKLFKEMEKREQNNSSNGYEKE